MLLFNKFFLLNKENILNLKNFLESILFAYCKSGSKYYFRKILSFNKTIKLKEYVNKKELTYTKS